MLSWANGRLAEEITRQLPLQIPQLIVKGKEQQLHQLCTFSALFGAAAVHNC